MRALTFIVTIALVACTQHNPNVCCTDQADCDAQGLPLGSVCADGLLCRGNQCIAESCSMSSECDLTAPYCVTSLCTTACTDDMQCPGFQQDAIDHYCVGGACVQCREGMNDCAASSPVCSAGACRACKAHSECGSGVCDFDTGLCISESSVIFAAPTGSSSSACTKAAPCSFVRAFTVVDSTRTIVKLAPGTYATLPAPLTGGYAITVYGETSIINNSGFSVNDATLRLRDITFTGTSSIGAAPAVTGGAMPGLDLNRVVWLQEPDYAIICNGPCTLTIAHSRFETAGGSGVVISLSGELIGASGATANRGSVATIDGTIFLGGNGPAVSVSNYSTVAVTNSVFDGADQAFYFGTQALSLNSSTVSFTTFHNTKLGCAGGATVVALRNNIFLNEKAGAPADTVGGSSCNHSFDLIKPQTTTVPGSNNFLNVDPRFVNGPGGDFHLVLGSPAIDAAEPAAADPVDFDGVARPQGAGRDLGAFEYH